MAPPRCGSMRVTRRRAAERPEISGRLERPTDKRVDRLVALAEAGVAFTAAARRRLRRASGIWCSRAMRGRRADVPVAQPRRPELGSRGHAGDTGFFHYVKDAGRGLSHIDLAVEGVNCAGCMAKIERGLSAIPDVTRARVNLTDRRVALEWKKGAIDPARFIDRLAELGYKAYPFEPVRAEAVEAEQSRFLLRCLGVAAFAAMNVMMLSIPVWSGNASDMLPEQRDFFHWLSALIALPAAAYAGQPFFRSAWRALRGGGVNMDVPISIGVVLALAMSVIETINHAEHAYFDAAMMLLTFLLAGRYLDQNMRRRTRAVAGNLAALKARDRRQIRRRRRDLAKCRSPPSIPAISCCCGPANARAVDGNVVEGRSEIDQSLITGETLHVKAEPARRSMPAR